MKKLLIIAICFLSLLASSSVVLGKLQLLPLSYMVEKAEIIAIGRVVKVEQTSEKRGEALLSKATIEIEKTFKGNRHTKTIEAFFLQDTEDEPKYSIADRSVFFIHKYRGKLQTLQGYAGKIDIANDEARNIHMHRESSNQQLDGFINKIEKLLKQKSVTEQQKGE